MDEVIDPTIVQLLKQSSVSLVTLPLWGSTRITDYLVYKLKKISRINTIYVHDLNKKNILSNNLIVKSKFNVLVIKRYWEQPIDFQRKVLIFAEKYNERVVTVIVVTPEMINNVDSYFGSHTRHLDYIQYLRLLTYKQFEEMIDLRLKSEERKMPKSIYPKIYELTHGHGALTKYVCKYYYENNSLDVDKLI